MRGVGRAVTALHVGPYDAETLARDPVLAARVATLTRLKQGVKREVKAAVVPPPRAPMARA